MKRDVFNVNLGNKNRYLSSKRMLWRMKVLWLWRFCLIGAKEKSCF